MYSEAESAPGGPEKEIISTEALGRIARELQEAARKIELSPEIISQSQAIYDFIGYQVDIQNDYEQGKIDLPTPEEQEAAKKAGYTLALIEYPDRNQIIQKTNAKYDQEFDSYEDKGVWLSSDAQRDLPQTQAAQNPLSKPRLVFVKPQADWKKAHPETKNTTFPQAQKLLEQENQKNPDLNLEGWDLPLHLLADTHHYLATKEHLNWVWLLKEQAKDNQGNPTRCLNASWSSGSRRVGVFSVSASDRNGVLGARFAAVPKTESST